MTRETVPGLKDMQYGHNPGMNNGRVMSTTDNISGETVQYMYDRLNRLMQAQTSSGSTPWGDAYTYDGFGNLTGKSPTQGSAPGVSLQYDPGTNQPINQYYGDGNNSPQYDYDANGNAPVGTWDIENRLVSQTLDGDAIQWAYDPSGKRVLKYQANGAPVGQPMWTFYLYNDSGQRLAEVTCTNAAGCAPTTTNTYFGGKLIAAVDSAGHVLGATDRLGTVRAVATSGTWAEPTYYPYGEQHTPGGVDTKEQFATYVRDSTLSAQDYAMARYYSNNTGRFLSTDKGAPDPKNPGSWNRYAYVQGDPVNFRDPSGRDMCIPVYDIDALSRGSRMDEGDDDCAPGGGAGPGGGGGYCGGADYFDPTPDPYCPAAEPAPEPAPLTCDYQGAVPAQAVTTATGTSGNHAGTPATGNFVGEIFEFGASGGSGGYVWDNYQTGYDTGWFMLANGIVVPLYQPVNDNPLPSATFFNGALYNVEDVPGLAGPTPVAGAIGFYLSLTVWVTDSSGDQVPCGTIDWSVTLSWVSSGGKTNEHWGVKRRHVTPD